MAQDRCHDLLVASLARFALPTINTLCRYSAPESPCRYVIIGAIALALIIIAVVLAVFFTYRTRKAEEERLNQQWQIRFNALIKPDQKVSGSFKISGKKAARLIAEALEGLISYRMASRRRRCNQRGLYKAASLRPRQDSHWTQRGTPSTTPSISCTG